MKKVKKLLAENSQGLMLAAGIGLGNLVFFQQAGWKMEPIRIGLLSLVLYGLLRIFFSQWKRIREDKRMAAGTMIFALLFGAMVVVGQKISVEQWVFQDFGLSDIIWFLFYTGLGMLIFTGLNWLYVKIELGCIEK